MPEKTPLFISKLVMQMLIFNLKSLEVFEQFDFTHHKAEALQLKRTPATGCAGSNIEINLLDDGSCLNVDMKKVNVPIFKTGFG